MPILWVFLFLNAQTILYAQQTDVVDFLRIEASVTPDAAAQKIDGRVQVTFKILKKTDSIFMNGVQMTVEKTGLSGISVSASTNKIWLSGRFSPGDVYTANFLYEAFPKQALYFMGDQIWTQGQGNYTSHWLPSIDDMNDKIEFDLQILAPSGKTVVANGKLQNVGKQTLNKAWNYDMVNPMSSYLAAFAIGDFDYKSELSESGIPLAYYFKPEDSAKVEPTYRYGKRIFDFLEKEIGHPYPWQNYKQLPVRDFLYAGMENTSITIFSEAFVVDSIGFNDRNYINVNAHELAHQWFGNLVTETSGTHHWLQEGFATYYAHLVEQELFGDDFFYWTMYNTAEQLKSLSDAGKGETLLNPEASSLTFYEKGAWALHILRELIGDKAFKTAVQNYLNKHQFGNVVTEDFLDQVKAAAIVDISQWEEDWLNQSAFKAEQAIVSLARSPFMEQYFKCSALRRTPLTSKLKELNQFLDSGNEFIQQEVIYQLEDEAISETLDLYQKGFRTGNLYVRQAIALSLLVIPPELMEACESLLNDPSYVTREAALFNLWNNFPAKRIAYLNATDGIIGFQDRNLRQLWLAMAIFTEGFREDQKELYIEELRGYTSAQYSFEVREKAFAYISELRLYNDAVIKNLINASIHPNWRFRNESRKLLNEVLKNPGTAASLRAQYNSFNEKERQFLQTLMSL
jgi:aminopeptidase N